MTKWVVIQRIYFSILTIERTTGALVRHLTFDSWLGKIKPIPTAVASPWWIKKFKKVLLKAQCIAVYHATLKGCICIQLVQPSTFYVKIWWKLCMSRNLSGFPTVSVGLTEDTASLTASNLTSCITHMQLINKIHPRKAALPCLSLQQVCQLPS